MLEYLSPNPKNCKKKFNTKHYFSTKSVIAQTVSLYYTNATHTHTHTLNPSPPPPTPHTHSTWFQSNWKRIISVATAAPNCLPNFQYLTDQLDNLVHPNYLDRSGLASMWTHLASSFMDYIKEVWGVVGEARVGQ